MISGDKSQERTKANKMLMSVVKGMIFVIDKHSTLHEKWWNEKGYHNTDVVCNLPRYKYFIATISIFRYSVPDALTNIGSLEPFFGDIEN